MPTTPSTETARITIQGTPPCRVETGRIADQLERAYRGGAWHGPSLSEQLEGVSAALATRQTIPGSHTIHELVWHMAFWTDAARRRAEGEIVTGLPEGSDFPPAPADPESAWRETKTWLEETHRRLHALVLGLDDERLDDPAGDSTVRGQLLGLLQHHAYHNGQVLMLARAGAGVAR